MSYIGLLIAAVLPIVGLLVLGQCFFARATPEPTKIADAPDASLALEECAWQSPASTPIHDKRDPLLGLPGGDIPPIRRLHDPYPEFNGIAVDPVNNVVALTDQNLKSLLIYDRRVESAKPANSTEPLKQIIGPLTGMGFISGIAIDPVEREVFVGNNDIEDRMVVFSLDAEGNVTPKRELYTPTNIWGLALDRTHNEIALTNQWYNAVIVYRRDANRFESPLREIVGPNTGMGDPRGVYIDSANDELIVASQGYFRGELIRTDYTQRFGPLLPSTGHITSPSIRVFERTATGNTKPVRVIEGSQTLLNWPMGISADNTHNEIAVANNAGNSILIFRRTDTGDVAPIRSIAGDITELDHPVGVYIDTKNDELGVANLGNHSATIYARTASGNIAPKRVIRSAPAGTLTTGLGNPMAVAYDSKRDKILVPN